MGCVGLTVNEQKGCLPLETIELKWRRAFVKKQKAQVTGKRKDICGIGGLEEDLEAVCRERGMVVNETAMPARYEALRNYFHNRFTGSQIAVMYEAGFAGFELHDQWLEPV